MLFGLTELQSIRTQILLLYTSHTWNKPFPTAVGHILQLDIKSMIKITLPELDMVWQQVLAVLKKFSGWPNLSWVGSLNRLGWQISKGSKQIPPLRWGQRGTTIAKNKIPFLCRRATSVTKLQQNKKEGWCEQRYWTTVNEDSDRDGPAGIKGISGVKKLFPIPTAKRTLLPFTAAGLQEQAVELGDERASGENE